MKTYFTRRRPIGLVCFLCIGIYGAQAQNIQGPKQKRITTVWDGSSWNNGEPDANAKAVFAADYNADKAFVASDVEVSAGANVVFRTGSHLFVTDLLNVSPMAKLTLRQALI